MSEAPLFVEAARGKTAMKTPDSNTIHIIPSIDFSEAFISLLSIESIDSKLLLKTNQALVLTEEEVDLPLTDTIEAETERGALAQIDLAQIEAQLPKKNSEMEAVTSNKLQLPLPVASSPQKVEVPLAVPVNFQKNLTTPLSAIVDNKMKIAPESAQYERLPSGSSMQTTSQDLTKAKPEQRMANDHAFPAKLSPAKTDDNLTKQALPNAVDAASPAKPIAVAGRETSQRMSRASTPQMGPAQQSLAPLLGDAPLQTLSLKGTAPANIDTRKKLTSEISTAPGGVQTRPETETYALAREMKTTTPVAMPAVNFTSPPLVAQQEIDTRSADRLNFGAQFETFARPVQGSQNPAAQASPQHNYQDARHIANQLATQFSKQRDGTTVIRLNPDELGQVRMTMRTIDGVMSMTIVAERPETADIMRRNINDLAQEFQSLGFENLNFEFNDDGAQQKNAAAQDTLQDTEQLDRELPTSLDPPPHKTADGRLNLRL